MSAFAATPAESAANPDPPLISPEVSNPVNVVSALVGTPDWFQSEQTTTPTPDVSGVMLPVCCPSVVQSPSVCAPRTSAASKSVEAAVYTLIAGESTSVGAPLVSVSVIVSPVIGLTTTWYHAMTAPSRPSVSD